MIIAVMYTTYVAVKQINTLFVAVSRVIAKCIDDYKHSTTKQQQRQQQL